MIIADCFRLKHPPAIDFFLQRLKCISIFGHSRTFFFLARLHCHNYPRNIYIFFSFNSFRVPTIHLLILFPDSNNFFLTVHPLTAQIPPYFHLAKFTLHYTCILLFKIGTLLVTQIYSYYCWKVQDSQRRHL